MMMIQCDVDVVTLLMNLLPSNYEIVIPSLVINELNKLKHKSKGKDKLAASIALKLAESEPFVIRHIKKTEHVDNLLLKYCTQEDVLCTNDKVLRTRAREKSITVIYLRQHRYLEVDGYIKRNKIHEN
ncbi:MAG: twitching motility protein PilT [Methanosphaera stadtmanae]|nr:twitching motility protein PilT [Methanosphaera stadtmanae]